MNLFVPVIVAAGLLAQSTPSQVRVWKSGDIDARGAALAKKLDAQKVASEVIAKEGNRTFMVAHREGSGLAEVHDKEADIMVISRGEVTMVYGGTVVDGKTHGARRNTRAVHRRGHRGQARARRRPAHPREGSPPDEAGAWRAGNLLRYEGG